MIFGVFLFKRLVFCCQIIPLVREHILHNTRYCSYFFKARYEEKIFLIRVRFALIRSSLARNTRNYIFQLAQTVQIIYTL